MSAAQDFTLDQLADDGDEGFEMGRAPTFKTGIAYPVKVVGEETTVSANGWYVYKAKLAIAKADGGTGGEGTVTLCLPTFSDDVQGSVDAEKLAMLKQTWGTRLHGFLRAALPAKFSVYASSTKIGNRWKFFDSEGREMSGAEKKQREELLSKAVIGTAKAIVAGKFSAKDTGLYFVRTQDKKDPNKTYDNFYSEPPRNYPLYEG